MASPVVQEAIESSTNTAGTSHVVTLPTATSGQLLLIILDKGSTAATINAHGSLTELLDENSANGLYIAYRWMDGTEPSSYTLTSSASTRSARIAYRISGAENPATQAPQIGTTATGTSATPDPPASATPGSSKDYLFIAFYGAAGEEADDDTWSDTPPTNYTPSPPRQKACGTVGTNLGGMIAAAERALTTGSAENPGTFAKDASAAWRAQTIMVHPAAPVTHATDGALTGPGSAVVGSASSSTARPSSGVLAGQGSAVVGSASRTRAHPSTGVLAGPGSAVVGSANRESPAFVTHATDGVLAGQGAAVVGAASSATARPSSGVLVGPGAAIVGEATRFRAHPTTGVLAGPGSTVDGAASNFTVHGSSGVLEGPGAFVDGAAARSGGAVTHETDGALVGGGAVVSGEAEAGAPGGFIFKREKYYRDVPQEEEPKPKKVKKRRVIRLINDVARRQVQLERPYEIAPLVHEFQRFSIDWEPKFEPIYWERVKAALAEIDDEEAIILLM